MQPILALSQSLALLLAQPSAPVVQSDPPAANDPEAEKKAAADPAPAPSARFESCGARRFNCCVPGSEFCTRSRPARLILGIVGAAAWGLGSSLFLLVGDRIGIGDPAGLLIGGGALGLLGAVTGSIAGLFGNDGRRYRDRVTPGTLELEYAFGRLPALDERDPDLMRFRFAPSFAFPHDQGRLRLIGHVGGLLGNARAVDPRPQNDAPLPDQEGTFPTALSERRLDIGVGLDLAVKLPYPARRARKSPALGRAELRYKPTVEIRRHQRTLGGGDEQIEERVMFLPLTVGARWHLSERQRFTFYAGPRFDFLSFSAPGSKSLARGPAQNGPVYGEAWYDIDIPLTNRPRLDEQPRKVDAVGMLTLGYVHSRFDGLALNLGPAIGFLGPGHVAWNMRFRRRGSPVAFQAGLGTWVGNGATVFLRAALITPVLTREHFRKKGRR